MKTVILVVVEHHNDLGSDLTRRTRTLVDSFLYQPGVIGVQVNNVTKYVTPAGIDEPALNDLLKAYS